MRREGGAKESESICSEFETPRSLQGLHGLRLLTGYCTWDTQDSCVPSMEAVASEAS